MPFGSSVNRETFRFDTSTLNGSPMGRPFADPKRKWANALPPQTAFPAPAQQEVFRSVINEKVDYLQANPDKIYSVSVFKQPNSGNLFLQDGQHRLIASAMISRPVDFNISSRGAMTGSSWQDTKWSDGIPAKEKLKRSGW